MCLRTSLFLLNLVSDCLLCGCAVCSVHMRTESARKGLCPVSCSELQTSGACGLWWHQVEQDRGPGGCSWIDWGPEASSSSSDPCIECTILYWSSGEKEKHWVSCTLCSAESWLCRWVQVRALLPLCIDLAGLGRCVGWAWTCYLSHPSHTHSECFRKPQLGAIPVTVRQQLHLLLSNWQNEYCDCEIFEEVSQNNRWVFHLHTYFYVKHERIRCIIQCTK